MNQCPTCGGVSRIATATEETPNIRAVFRCKVCLTFFTADHKFVSTPVFEDMPFMEWKDGAWRE